MKRKSSRRDFLRGRSATDAMADAVENALPDADKQSDKASTAVPGYLLQVSRRAMACEFQVSLRAGQYENGTETALEALDLVERLEAQMSVFREDSEIRGLNRSAAVEPVGVEAGLFELIQLSLRLHEETDGALDITAGPLWEVWGFARREGTVPSQQQLDDALKLVDSRMVELDPAAKTVHFKRPGMKLNLGSIGKGYALDRCCRLLMDEGINDFLFHGGQSSVVARGHSTPTPTDQSKELPAPWIVGIRHPLRPDRRIAEICLRDRALSTSGARIQSFRHKGQRYGHIIDPRNGQPAEGIISATAIAPSGAEADALSTAFYVMGAEAALRYCQAHEGIGAVLLCPVRHSGGVELVTAGLEDDELTAL
jgi:thiamine biosynthesis lipoprotein